MDRTSASGADGWPFESAWAHMTSFPGQRVPLPGLYDTFLDISFFDRTFKTSLIELLKLRGDENIADIGCGTGKLLILIKQRYPKTKLIDIDPDPRMLQLAQDKARTAGLIIEFRKGEGSKIPLPSRSMDVVICTLTLHHMSTQYKTATLKEMNRVAKYQGSILIADIDQPTTWWQKLYLLPLSLVEKRSYFLPHLRGEFPKILKAVLPKAILIGRHQFVTIWQSPKQL